MKIRIYLAIMLGCCPLAVQGQEVQALDRPQLGAGIYVSSDNEDFITRRQTVEYLFQRTEEKQQFGVRARHHTFVQNDWSENAKQILATGNGKLLQDQLLWLGEAGMLEQNGKQLLTVDASMLYTLSPQTKLEAFLSRDFVETAAALEQGIHVTFGGVSIEQIINPHFTAVAVLGYQDFSDDNDRLHGRLRLIYQPSLDLGLTLQFRYRYFESDRNETRRAYFNPERYDEEMLLVGWRKRGNGWSSLLLAGAGRQDVNGDGRTPTRLLEASLNTAVAKAQHLSLGAGYNRSASVSGPDYRYRYARVNWRMDF